jgi:hypothetical protein
VLVRVDDFTLLALGLFGDFRVSPVTCPLTLRAKLVFIPLEGGGSRVPALLLKTVLEVEEEDV